MTTVRWAATRDLPWLRQLFAQLVQEQLTAYPDVTYPRFDPTALDDFIEVFYGHQTRNPNFAAFVAWDDRADRAVGFIAGEIVTRVIGAPHRYGLAHWLYVEPAHRSTGLAGQLIAAGMDWLRQHGIEDLEFMGLPDDPLWPRHGGTCYMKLYHVPIGPAAADPLWSVVPAERKRA